MATTSPPSTVLELVERFERNLSACEHAQADRDEYLSGRYNEAQVCQDFLNPFFEALGWDVQNKLGFAEAYRDVIHEDSLEIGGGTKAPDYCLPVAALDGSDTADTMIP